MQQEWDYFYCKSCKKRFKAVVSRPYYNLNHWIENQWHLTKDLVDKHNIIPIKHHDIIIPNKTVGHSEIYNCPFCYSKHNVNIGNLKEECEKYIKQVRGGSLKYSGNMMKDKLKLYNEIKQRYKSLNTIKNK